MTIPGTVPNHSGGHGFAVDDWTRLRRFLVLGSASGTYYQSERALTRENAACVTRCVASDPQRTVEAIVAVSKQGVAPRNDPALFALALCAAGPEPARKIALGALQDVARTGTHLLHFAEYVNALRGWGRGLRQAVARWYLQRPMDDLALQLVKYRQRDGWSHRDLLRLAHPRTSEPLRNAALRYAVKGAEQDVASYPRLIEAAIAASRSPQDLSELIRAHDLPRECVPTEQLQRADVWAALLERMPYTAMIRNLAKMTQVGLVAEFSEAAKLVAERLSDGQALRRARVHPFAILLALRTYQRGHGFRGQLSWRPVARVLDALDAAFYASFANVEPTGRNVLIGLDVSGSMDCSIAGSPLSAREAACAMAMVAMRSEQNWAVVAFSHELVPLPLTGRERLDDVMERTRRIRFGATDCALPLIAAREQGWPIDVFQIYTDNETNTGALHPAQALALYRRQSGRAARLAVAAFTATSFSIADPNDAGMLDVAGLDASLPGLLAEFTRGNL